MTNTPPNDDISRAAALRVAWDLISALPDIWQKNADDITSSDITAGGMVPPGARDSFARGQAAGLRIAARGLADNLPRLARGIQCVHGVLPCDTYPEECR